MSNLIINPYRFAAGGGFVTDIHQPASTTALLRAGFASNALASGFDTNTITATVTGTLTHNASGGLGGGGFANSFSKNTNFIALGSALYASDASSANQLTLIAAFKTTDSAASTDPYGTRRLLFGDNTGTVSAQWGVSGGYLHIAAGSTTPQGAISVADGNWHLVAFQQTAADTFQLWVDGVKDNTATHAGSGYEYVREIGSGRSAYSSSLAMADIDAVQIYRPTLSDADLGEIFTQAGF